MDPWVVQMLKNRYAFCFDTPPPTSTGARVVSAPKDPVKKAALENLLVELLTKNVIEEVRELESKGFCSRFFVVPKRTSGKWRAILDLSTLNSFVNNILMFC